MELGLERQAAHEARRTGGIRISLNRLEIPKVRRCLEPRGLVFSLDYETGATLGFYDADATDVGYILVTQYFGSVEWLN